MAFDFSRSVAARCIDWRAARRAVAEADGGAGQTRSDRRVNIARGRSGRTLAAFLRMPGAPLHSVEIAIDKAYTAASFGLPTARWTELLAVALARRAPGPVQRPRFSLFGGGLPLREADGADRCDRRLGRRAKTRTRRSRRLSRRGDRTDQLRRRSTMDNPELAPHGDGGRASAPTCTTSAGLAAADDPRLRPGVSGHGQLASAMPRAREGRGA
jgi:uncharacterized protein GlcG (DUF336 family)